MLTMLPRRALALALAGAASFVTFTADAASSSFAVNPTTVTLSAKQPTSLLSLRNSNATSVRFQISVYGWSQRLDGGTDLVPTRDIILFPPLLTLEPGAERKVRIGSVVPPQGIERSYRIIVEELPSHVAPGADDPPGLTVLTRLSIPLFIHPTLPKAQVTVDEMRLENGVAAVNVRNTGTVHFLVRDVTLRGVGRTGQTVLEQTLAGWYVLAGTGREFVLPVKGDACRQISALVADVRVADTTLTDRLEVPMPSCGSSPAP